PRARALRRLDVAGAGPGHRPHAPDPRAPGVDRASSGRRSRLCHGGCAPGAGRPGAAVPARVAAGAGLADEWQARSRGGAAAGRLAGGAGRAARTGAAAMTDAVEERPPVTLREPVVGAPGAQVIVISGPSGVGKDTVIDELKKRNADHRWAFVVTYKSREP